jgi:hypothetical protein
MKFHIMGHGGHGKDTASSIFAYLRGCSWVSSSMYASEIIVHPVLGLKYGYQSVEECYNDRRNHREEWYDLIKAYGEGDPARFSRKLFKHYDIYCGIRNREEFLAGKKEDLFDLAIWIDASERLPPEDESSCTITKADADIIIDNNGDQTDLARRLFRLVNIVKC